MAEILTALYARVSSDQQAEAHTIGSQVAALRARVAEDGLVVPAEREFLDDGFSGATLVRPGLERLRDLAAEGVIDRVYVHSPDRLARKYAYQALLLDEFQAVGVQVVFLNRALGQSPEDELLLQVQGVMAEYERAKILERSRRGKRHGHTWATWRCYPARRLAIATFERTKVVVRPATRSCWMKRVSSARCSTGSGWSAPASARCVAD